jgi:hypothetical protein
VAARGVLVLHIRGAQVLATEIAKPSVELARLNMAANGCDNVTIDKKDSEDFSKAFSGSREMRLGVQGDGPSAVRPSLRDFDLRTLFVDPPRAGMDEVTCAVAATFQRLVYISCNPETMARDIGRIVKSLPPRSVTIEKFAVFDQFPYTHHLECGAIIRIAQPNPRAPAAVYVPPSSSSSSSSSSSTAAAAAAATEPPPSRLDCNECDAKFLTRNALFRHLDVSGHGADGAQDPQDDAALAYIKTHRAEWVEWLVTQSIHHVGNDPARHDAAVHERFHQQAERPKLPDHEPPAAKRHKLGGSGGGDN